MTNSPVSYRLLRTGGSLPPLIFPQISRDSLDNGLVLRVSLPSFSSTATRNGRLRVLTHVTTMCRPIAVSPVWPLPSHSTIFPTPIPPSTSLIPVLGSCANRVVNTSTRQSTSYRRRQLFNSTNDRLPSLITPHPLSGCCSSLSIYCRSPVSFFLIFILYCCCIPLSIDCTSPVSFFLIFILYCCCSPLSIYCTSPVSFFLIFILSGCCSPLSIYCTSPVSFFLIFILYCCCSPLSIYCTSTVSFFLIFILCMPFCDFSPYLAQLTFSFFCSFSFPPLGLLRGFKSELLVNSYSLSFYSFLFLFFLLFFLCLSHFL
ncbi:unnamed protein product [Acanthosepion pharaonis]|uniref:Uncharacterized protein n=1 Tax=Acanthosepion pharaonis TaxID=158019 RepID=A0A812DDV3_ACAPH|nr:unnamed protein product [Sepia pharaonis]